LVLQEYLIKPLSTSFLHAIPLILFDLLNISHLTLPGYAAGPCYTIIPAPPCCVYRIVEICSGLPG